MTNQHIINNNCGLLIPNGKKRCAAITFCNLFINITKFAVDTYPRCWQRFHRGKKINNFSTTKGGKMSFSLSNDAKRFLIRIALDAIISKFKQQRLTINTSNIPDELNFKAGCFVTIQKNGALRGCIGNFREDKNIVENVAEMALQAAFNDVRFPPLSENELEQITIEISVLSPMIPVNSFDEIVIGRDGLYITKYFNSGVLLPQVATEHGWDVTEFLEYTCLKAGLPKNAYEDTDTKIYRFEALVFSEKDIG